MDFKVLFLLHFITTTAYFVNYVKTEIFTAMADIEMLLRSEDDIMTMIDSYIETERKRLDKLKRVAQEYQEKNRAIVKAGVGYVSNPLNSYLLIKRLTTDWSYLESLMRNNMAEVFLTNITNQREANAIQFPNDEDLKGAAVGLMRLQDVYKLDTRDMAQGQIKGLKSSEELEAHDCFELGRIAYNEADYYHTLMWMQEALNRMEHEDPPTANYADILEYLAFSLYQQGNLKRALTMTRKLKEIDPTHPRVDGNIKWYQDMMAKEGLKRSDEANLPPVVNPRKDDGGVTERDIYESLCRNEYPLNEQLKKSLYCYYKRDKPFLRLAPLKAEIVFRKPKIIIFRNVMSDEEIELIKEMALPRLARATVQNAITGDLEPANYRISKSAWLKPEEHPILARINQRQEDMSGLTMSTAEDLQIANYGIGGHYDPHFDFARKEETNAFKGLNSGNRVATILHYMSTPELGGATVFPELKVALFPTKNDAVFWFNLLKSGEGDMTTRHAACPVLVGVKWVSNRWIHERGQEWRRPCSRNENAYE